MMVQLGRIRRRAIPNEGAKIRDERITRRRGKN
jgi:hypothetical protein